MRRPILTAFLLAALSGGVRVLADVPGSPAEAGTPPSSEDRDLALIPPSAQQPSNNAAAPAGQGQPRRMYLENALTLSSQRGELLVPPPPPPPYDWQSRLFLDWREEWGLGHGLRLSLSDRLNLRFENDIDSPSQQNLLNEPREL